MFVTEAKWIGTQVRSFHFPRVPVRCLNLGSSTRIYREINQPHVYQYVFKPLLQIGDVTHVDLKAADGVDIAGDFMDKAFWTQIPIGAFGLVMCSNLLTHVTDERKIFDLIRRSVEPGGYVIISTPRLYPYCSDPVDTKYRPTAGEILKHFESFELVSQTEIRLEDTHFARMLMNPKLALSFLANVFLPTKGVTRWKAVVSDIPNIFEPLSTVCLVLQAPGKSQ